MNVRSIGSHRSLLTLLGASLVTLSGCPGNDVTEPPPVNSGFDESGNDDSNDTGDTGNVDETADDGPVDPTNAGDDGGEPEPPGDTELCDAGDEAWVKRAIPFIQGRKPESMREVRLLVSAIEQLDAQELDGRRLVANALAQGDLYLDRWRNYYFEQLRVHRRGDQRNSECYGDLTVASLEPDLADAIRNDAPNAAPAFDNVTMGDVVLSSLRLDDITPAYSADMFARMGTPITGGNVTREQIEVTNRAYYGKLFESQYLGRTTECLQCHTTGWSTTDFANPDDDRHWPVHEGQYFEIATYGNFTQDDPLSEEDVHALFRHAGFVDFSWCDSGNQACNFNDAIGIRPWGLDFNCGLFRQDAFQDPFVDLDNVSYMGGPFPEGAGANLFDLEPRFREGLDTLANEGVAFTPSDDYEANNLDNPVVGMAFLFAMNQANEMWKEGMGYSLTVANRFPRNTGQRDTLNQLTEAFYNSNYSVRTLIAEVATHPYFNQAPPDSCGTANPYHMPAVFDPFTKSAVDPQERGNGVGDMVHRYSAQVLIQSAMRSMWWDMPEQFGNTTAYAFLVAYIADNPGSPPNVNPHYPVGQQGAYGLCGAGFFDPCDDEPNNVDFLRDEGVFINTAEGGFNGIDFNGLLHWEEELASGLDPNLGGQCTGPLDVGGQFGQNCAAADFTTQLVDTAGGQPGTLMADIASALKDRLIAEPEIYGQAEIDAIEGIMGVSLDDPVADVGQVAALAATRRYAGVLLNTPQFMLDGVVSAPQPPESDPVIVVPGTDSQSLCDNFAGLADQASSWSALTVNCAGDSITVQ